MRFRWSVYGYDSNIRKIEEACNGVKLKRCPICGKSVKMETSSYFQSHDDWRVMFYTGCCNIFVRKFDSPSEVADVWNKIGK